MSEVIYIIHILNSIDNKLEWFLKDYDTEDWLKADENSDLQHWNKLHFTNLLNDSVCVYIDG